ncbi:hypothetical protein DPMN_017573 [Dreissena polymorpha]|uniref:Uncharacterized protein n=1 Tax=Dreissena polymorpha TaxID=45954 RepID=A0A9D4NFM0_DREPO|nr:hypothetical protein DPMN_017573 [Dreissena polymorpha]
MFPSDVLKQIQLLTKFESGHRPTDRQTGKLTPIYPPHAFQWSQTNFESGHNIIRTNILGRFQKEWTKNITSRVCALVPYTIGTNLTIVHGDWALNVASRVLTR